MKYEINVGNYFIHVDTNNGGGSIASNIKEGCCCDNSCCIGCAAVDGVESLILAHACAGINVSDPKYIEGIETALNAIGENIDDE